MNWLLASLGIFLMLLGLAVVVGRFLGYNEQDKDRRELRRYDRYIKAMNKSRKS